MWRVLVVQRSGDSFDVLHPRLRDSELGIQILDLSHNCGLHTLSVLWRRFWTAGDVAAKRPRVSRTI